MNVDTQAHLFRDRVLLAPLTRGGNLPFRRLVLELGGDVTCGEMALSRHIVRGKRGEMALLRRAAEEVCFGAQLAGRNPEELARAAAIAEEKGADFVDLNLGCPIDLFCRRGLGAALMGKPGRVEAIVRAMRDAVDIPVTAKFRLGYDAGRPRYREVAAAAIAGGASALTLHGRSRNQRYKLASDWDAVAQLVAECEVPIIGNGDLLTWRDVRYRKRQSGCASVMFARGALIKPWVFRETLEERDYCLDPEERLDLLRRYRELALDHFGRDAHGRERVADFLTWHLDFFNRYRPEPSREPNPEDHPLIQTRQARVNPPSTGLAGLLYDTDEENRRRISSALMDEIDTDPQRSRFWREHEASRILDRHLERS